MADLERTSLAEVLILSPGTSLDSPGVISFILRP